MFYFQSSNNNRFPGSTHRSPLRVIRHVACGCLALTVLAGMPSESALAEAENACDIGRPASQRTYVRTPGAVGSHSWIQRVGDGAAALDPAQISVLSWNIKKGSEAGWQPDLHRLSSGKDLVLLQEAQLKPKFYDPLENTLHRNGARGWKSSGVLTAARAKQLNRCGYQHQEPLLGTPKASLLTEYPLVATDETLLVVNVHVVNFALGLSEFRQQIGDLHQVMARHAGPIIFSGDFNTWRSSRMALLNEFAASLGLKPVRFAEDNRIRKFGYALDHLFVRGLGPLSSRVEVVQSSDHNPLIAVFGAVDEIATNDSPYGSAGGEI